METPEPFNIGQQEICNGLIIEASAGTGKTYAVAAMVTVLLATQDDLRIGNVLVTTFTRNASAELRDRVRRRLINTAMVLRDENFDTSTSADEVVKLLWKGSVEVRAMQAARLERAVSEFDTATISTIHGVCTRILRVAGIPSATASDAHLTSQIVHEVVNDALLKRLAGNYLFDEERMVTTVILALSNPTASLHFSVNGRSDSDIALLEETKQLVAECVAEVHDRMTMTPSYDDLLRRAQQVVADPLKLALVEELRSRFAVAVIDEAQDTDSLQWSLFSTLFPSNGPNRLIAVGDPKQAIYGWRGADVAPYIEVRDASGTTLASLNKNHRSDQDLLDGLNSLMKDSTFGEGIPYIKVEAFDKDEDSRIVGPAPIHLINADQGAGNFSIARAAAVKVTQLLDENQTKLRIKGQDRSVQPRDIAILVRSGLMARTIERQLRRLGIRAVSNGTESVFDSEMARELRALVEALDRPSDTYRARRAAITKFIGYAIKDVTRLSDDDLIEVQEQLVDWALLLRRHGIAALNAQLMARQDVMGRLLSGSSGERNLTDLSHLVELLHKESLGLGSTAEDLLVEFDRLKQTDDTSEIVSRRIESDEDAVQILTIHTAKGLQYPIVIVAEQWEARDPVVRDPKNPLMYHPIPGKADRVIDIGWIHNKMMDPDGKERSADESNDESKRLLYVAATRAQHHLCMWVVPPKEKKWSILASVFNLEATHPSVQRGDIMVPSNLADLKPQKQNTDKPKLMVAPFDKQLMQTKFRTSFSGITAQRTSSHDPTDPYADLVIHAGGGNDESSDIDDAQTTTIDDVVTATVQTPLQAIPASAYVGTVIHEIFENTDFQAASLVDELRAHTTELAHGAVLGGHIETLVSGLQDVIRTPLGPLFNDIALGQIATTDRLDELSFDFTLASHLAGLRASQIGKLLREHLDQADVLYNYALQLADPSFDIPLSGQLTGSIDAVLRLPGSTPSAPRLVIVDYKSNRLGAAHSTTAIDSYMPERLVSAMASHHYPLQALLYSVAVYRFLRWRLGITDPSQCIAGIAYLFVRGMVGPNTPRNSDGQVAGVFAWQPPKGLVPALSDLLTAVTV